MNILLTSVGRRNYMVKYFEEAVKPYGGKVFVMNSTKDAVGMIISDYANISPLTYDSNYSDFLLNFSVRNNIDIIIPFFDVGLPKLAALKELFKKNGVRIIVGDKWLTTMANDKWATYKFLRENQMNTVQTFIHIEEFETAFKRQKLTYPVCIKPRWGMGSIGVYFAENIEEVHFFYKLVKREILKSYLKYESAASIDECVLIQQAFRGDEYGLDIINDLNGNYQTTIVKKKIAMRSGETDIAETIHVPELETLGEKISNLCKHPANMDVDVFYDKKEAFVLELNPRFGGGYPFSHIAGVNLPKAIIFWHLNEEVSLSMLTPQYNIKSMKGTQIFKVKAN